MKVSHSHVDERKMGLITSNRNVCLEIFAFSPVSLCCRALQSQTALCFVFICHLGISNIAGNYLLSHNFIIDLPCHHHLSWKLWLSSNFARLKIFNLFKNFFSWFGSAGTKISQLKGQFASGDINVCVWKLMTHLK